MIERIVFPRTLGALWTAATLTAAATTCAALITAPTTPAVPVLVTRRTAFTRTPLPRSGGVTMGFAVALRSGRFAAVAG